MTVATPVPPANYTSLTDAIRDCAKLAAFDLFPDGMDRQDAVALATADKLLDRVRRINLCGDGQRHLLRSGPLLDEVPEPVLLARHDERQAGKPGKRHRRRRPSRGPRAGDQVQLLHR